MCAHVHRHYIIHTAYYYTHLIMAYTHESHTHTYTYTHRVCNFPNEERGIINFEGNLLFTHFGEIGAPQGERPGQDHYRNVNTLELDKVPT